MTKRVGVLMGGMSTEREISLKSGRAVAAALRERGHDVVEIDVGPDLAERLRTESVGVAWLALHGTYGEDGCVQGMLEVLGIPYTGSGVQASAVAMDKILTKRILAGSSIPMPGDAVWREGDPTPEMHFPVVIKTPLGGSTLGIKFCDDAASLEAGLLELLGYDTRVLVEQGIAGREITVGLIDGRALPVVEIRPRGGHFDFDAKYTLGMTDYLVPAPISDGARARAQTYAEKAFRILGLRGIARADFMLDSDETPWFLEINTIPGMTATSLTPMAAQEDGMSFEDLVERALASARLERSPAQ